MKKRKQNNKLVQYAKQMRLDMTEAEYALWYHLRRRDFCNVRFNRQVIIGNYIVDFVCRKRKIIIEVDGEQHAMNPGYDNKRTRYLNELGYKVIRFWNSEIFTDIENVLEVIYAELSNESNC